MVETRFPGEFSSIKVTDKVDLDILQGPEYKIEVHAYEHIIKNISTVVDNGQLLITNNNGCNFVRGYKKNVKVVVTVPSVLRVENWGVGITRFTGDFIGDRLKIIAESSGDIHFTGTVKKLATYSNGNGDIYLNAGNCDSLEVFMNGTNFLYGANFKVKEYISAITISMGDCFVDMAAAGRLDYEIYKSGNIYYKGQPALIRKLNTDPAKGRLIESE